MCSNHATELGQQRYNITLLFSIDMSVLMDACNAAYSNSVSAAEMSLCFILGTLSGLPVENYAI